MVEKIAVITRLIGRDARIVAEVFVGAAGNDRVTADGEFLPVSNRVTNPICAIKEMGDRQPIQKCQGCIATRADVVWRQVEEGSLHLALADMPGNLCHFRNTVVSPQADDD